jgi:hypothetical protein
MPLPALEVAARVAVAALSIGVFLVGAVAYARRPTRRMLLVLALFLVLLVQGLLLLVEVFGRDTPSVEGAYFLFQFVEVSLLAAILLKR